MGDVEALPGGDGLREPSDLVGFRLQPPEPVLERGRADRFGAVRDLIDETAEDELPLEGLPDLPAEADVELLLQPLRGQAVGDGQPGGVVGERHVLVAQRQRGLGHLADRAAAVGACRVAARLPPLRSARARRRGGAAFTLSLPAGARP